MKLCVSVVWIAAVFIACAGHAEEFQSHKPMRPLPAASDRPLPSDGPIYFVSAASGDDAADGSKDKPWKTVRHAVEKLKAGDTLCLRGGTYYEAATLSCQGAEGKPITIRSHPGELAILDGGYREFVADPAHAWEPAPGGAEGEFQSIKTYPAGGNFGNFADSMIPLHRYISMSDLRSKNEFSNDKVADRADDAVGMYCGPGVRLDEKTGRIHVRLAHTNLAGLGDRAYRGQTDPRLLPLVIAGAEYGMSIEGVKHLRLQDLVIRGGSREALRIDRSHGIELDGVSMYGSGMTLRTSAATSLKLVNCALRGHGAPWHSRFHHKYRAHAGYLILLDGDDIEFAHCEMTDNHDFLQLYHAINVRFHNTFVDNFNDDGFEPGPKRARGQILIYENLVTRVLSPFTAHGKKPIHVDAEPDSGVYIFRNVFDFRRGTYKSTPEKDDPTGAYLDEPTTLLAHDHGSPVHPIYYVYQNTFLMNEGASRGYFDMSWGAHTKDTTRRVFNNIFVQLRGEPGFSCSGLSTRDDYESDGNLFWSLASGSSPQPAALDKFRSSETANDSKKRYAPGWAAHDLLCDPKLVDLSAASLWPMNPALSDQSPAIGAGVEIPAAWPDPLRQNAKPDVGAIPHGQSFTVGIHGRIVLPLASPPGIYNN